MSCYEWETGEVLLPAGAVPTVKKSLRDVTNALHETAQRAAHTFWEQYAQRTRSTRLYNERLEAYLHLSESSSRSHGFYSVPEHPSGLDEESLVELHHLLVSVAERPHKLTSAEVAQAFPKATNRALNFDVGHEATISIRGRTLRWHVNENNHAVDRAHEHPVMRTLFTALNRVKWTRGTGGTSWGSNEYADDAAQSDGYNPLSTTSSYGPLGEQAKANEVGLTLARYRSMTGGSSSRARVRI